VSDIDTVVVDSLKALDPERPIREADISPAPLFNEYTPQLDMSQRETDTSDAQICAQREGVE
jgi:hypothetical protein